jgi:hypothetical protein
MSNLAKWFGFVRPSPARRNFAVPPQSTPRVLKEFRNDRHAALALIKDLQ